MAELRKTCKRYNDAGNAHSLTFSCFGRRPFLSKDRSRLWLIDAIGLGLRKHQFHLWAYVIMPEHVHLLVWPTRDQYDVSAFLRTLKTSVARKAVAYVKREKPMFLRQMLDQQPNGKSSFRFWQRGGGFDRNITEPTTVWNVIDYIHANPVRRGLCERPVEWLWSSAGDYANTHRGRLEINFDSLPRTPQG